MLEPIYVFSITHISTWRSYYTQLSATCLVIQLLPIMFSDLDSCAVIENKYFSYFPIQTCIPKLILSIILFPSNFLTSTNLCNNISFIFGQSTYFGSRKKWFHFDQQSFWFYSCDYIKIWKIFSILFIGSSFIWED